MYKYSLNVATHVCRNGHMGIAKQLCDDCGSMMQPLKLFTTLTRLPVAIVCHLEDDNAIVKDCEGNAERFDESFFVKSLCCPAVENFPLLAARLFFWKIITEK